MLGDGKQDGAWKPSGTPRNRNDVRSHRDADAVGHNPGRSLLLVMMALMALAASAWAAPSADAAFGIVGFSGGTFNPDGSSATQAGGHPHTATTTIEFPGSEPFTPDGAVKEVEVDLPPGFVGNPSATPERCTSTELVDNYSQAGRCPASAQIGVVQIDEVFFPPLVPTRPRARVPVYNMIPPPGAPAMFGFRIGAQMALLVPRIRTGGDYGITVRASEIPQLVALARVTVTLWGVPADPSHDVDRGLDSAGHVCSAAAIGSGFPCSNPAGYNPVAFLTSPGNCSGGVLTTTARAASWQRPDEVDSASFDVDTNGTPTFVEGCDKVPFDPQIMVRPTTSRPDSPTGLDVELSIPSDGLQNPDGLAQANLKRVRVTLPEGMTISPSSANGLTACTDSDLGLPDPGASSCPPASKIGTVSIETPLLEEPLDGEVYVRSQLSDDPASGDLFRIAIVVDNPIRGLRIKLAGRVVADPVTGRLTATFDDNPQVPFSKLTLHLKSGSRAPLVTPPTCGSKAVTADLSPWSAADPNRPTPAETVTRTSTFAIDCPGISGFSPAFDAGSIVPRGGAFSPLAVRIDRADGQEYLSGVSLQFPGGLAAKLKGVPLCSEDRAAAGTCPIESRIGTATVGAGPGDSPFFITGSVSLTGPYKGAPYGLSAAVRAVAGPFDLGTVVVRQAVSIDPVDAHLTVVSDPLPTIVKGVPLRLRSINVDVNRPGFSVNPTSCAPKQITATFTSTGGTISQPRQRFQVGDCQALSFTPALKLNLTGRRQRTDGKHPGLRALLTQPGGQANLKQAEAKLPLSLALDPDNAQALCEYEDGLRADCPRASIVGRAKAVTPLLNRPVAGPVYFVKGIRIDRRTGRRIRTLPTLLVPLRGEVAIDIRARSDVSGRKLVTTFESVPDAPVTRFELTLNGGAHGILVVNGNLCRRSRVASATLDAQNGRRVIRSVRMRAPCPKAATRTGGER